MDIAPWVWGVTIAVLLGVIALDFVIIARRPHEPSMREAGIWIAVYVSLAIAFGIGLSFTTSGQAVDFFTGWIVEYSMSMDNLFVFILILGSFSVPREHRQRVLLVGIALALVFRGLFIAAGAAAVNAFAGAFYVFGAFLLYTAWKLVAGGGDEDEEYKENAAVRLVRRVLPTTDTYDGARLFSRVNGKRVVTPMLMVMIAVGMTDILFALDSIPAIFGITQEPYLVFTANAFALMGLRQLYFLIGGLLDKLVYLSYGLSVILGFIGLKLILHAVHETTELHVPEIPTSVSLIVIVATLAATTVLSLLKSRRDARAAAAEHAAAAGSDSGTDSGGDDDGRGERVSV